MLSATPSLPLQPSARRSGGQGVAGSACPGQCGAEATDAGTELGGTRACLPNCWAGVGDDHGVTRAGVFTDELWAVIEPVLPSDVGRRGQRWSDHRR